MLLNPKNIVRTISAKSPIKDMLRSENSESHLGVWISAALYTVALAPFIVEHSSPEERVYLFSMSSVLMWTFQMLGSIIGGILPGTFAILLKMSTSDFLVSRMTLVCALVFQIAGLVPIYFIKEGIGSSSEHPKTFSFKSIKSKAK